MHARTSPKSGMEWSVRIRPLLKVGPTLPPRGGWGVCGLWMGGLLWFWAIWPKVPTPPQGGGGGLGRGGWVGGSPTLMGLTQQLGRGRD